MAKSPVHASVSKMKAQGTLQQILGWLLILLFSLCVILSIYTKTGSVSTIFFSAGVVLGIAAIVSGSKKKSLIRNFQNYSAMLANDPVKSIDFLAASLGITPKTAAENLSKMITCGLFPNAFIDKQSNCLVFTEGQQPRPPESDVSYVTVQCKGCGATNNVISGSTGECEYCGVPLTAPPEMSTPSKGKLKK